MPANPDDRSLRGGDRAPTQLLPMAPDELTFPFSFEKQRRSLRTTEAARPGIEVLLGRLAVPNPRAALGSDKIFERQLLLFGTESLLNIDYYTVKTRREERRQWAMNAGIYGLALTFVGVAIYLFIVDRDSVVAGSSQIAAVVGAVLAGAKFVTESQDFQKTRSSFWQAGAELKERLYSFIGEWCGRAWDTEQEVFVPDFVIALQGEIKRARDIQVEEQRRFYELMATPTRLLGATQALSGDAQAAVNAFVQASQSKDEAKRQHDLEQLSKERDRLLQMYPLDAARPPEVVAKLVELDGIYDRLVGGTGVTAAVTAAVATATVPVNSGGSAGVPFDGRRDDEPGIVR